MTHLENELRILRNDTISMWKLVLTQLSKTLHSLKTSDKDFSREVLLTEKRVNAMELQIDRDCENIFALFNPVAVDLRLVLATLKINNNLERIGDIAEGIARFIISETHPFDEELLKRTRFIEMFEGVIDIVEHVFEAYDKEDTKLARSIFKKDDVLDEINGEANLNISGYIKDHPDGIIQALNILSIIRKLERVGDQSTNIAEEIIFYLEAKVLKHK